MIIRTFRQSNQNLPKIQEFFFRFCDSVVYINTHSIKCDQSCSASDVPVTESAKPIAGFSWKNEANEARGRGLLTGVKSISCAPVQHPCPLSGRIASGICRSGGLNLRTAVESQDPAESAVAVEITPGSVCTSGDGPGLQNQWGA